MMQHQHDCKSLIASISDYMDGELQAEVCAELENHLKECHNCRVVVDTLRKTIDIYHDTAAGEGMPEDVRSRLFYRLDLADIQPEAQPARAGGICPHCGQGVLEVDGMLLLKCPECGFSEGGCST